MSWAPLAIGAGSALIGSMGKKSGSGYNTQQVSNFTPEQHNLFKSMFGNVGPDSYTARLAQGDEATFNQMEAPAFRQFNQLTGQNASRFSDMGMGARRGSGFQNAQGQLTSDFAQDLMSRRQALQRQAVQDLMGMSNDLLGQRPYENVMTPKQPGFGDQILGGIGQIAGQFGGSFAGKAGSNYANKYFG